MTPRIGTWVGRFGGPSLRDWTTRDHYVESVIEGDPVTRCGRRLGKRKGTLIAVAPPPINPCHFCGVPSEDDGSTQEETVP